MEIADVIVNDLDDVELEFHHNLGEPIEEPIPVSSHIYELSKVIRMCEGRPALNIQLFSIMRAL